MMILEAHNISKSYPLDGKQIDVLRQVTLSVARGQFLVVQGNSGSGKTTLLSLLSGLDKPSQGRIRILDTDITDLTEDQLAPFRNQSFGFVFQSFHLVPSLNALENVMFPAELNHDPKARSKSLELLKRVGLSQRCASFPHQLSGGEKQRVAICRALVNDPQIIFADEPTGNLDSANGNAILQLLTEIHRERETTMVLVTHSRDIAQRADRIVYLKDGRINHEISDQP